MKDGLVVKTDLFPQSTAWSRHLHHGQVMRLNNGLIHIDSVGLAYLRRQSERIPNLTIFARPIEVQEHNTHIFIPPVDSGTRKFCLRECA